MSLINFTTYVDLANSATPSSGFSVGYDLDGILKQKDQYGIIKNVSQPETQNLMLLFNLNGLVAGSKRQYLMVGGKYEIMTSNIGVVLEYNILNGTSKYIGGSKDIINITNYFGYIQTFDVSVDINNVIDGLDLGTQALEENANYLIINHTGSFYSDVNTSFLVDYSKIIIGENLYEIDDVITIYWIIDNVINSNEYTITNIEDNIEDNTSTITINEYLYIPTYQVYIGDTLIEIVGVESDQLNNLDYIIGDVISGTPYEVGFSFFSKEYPLISENWKGGFISKCEIPTTPFMIRSIGNCLATYKSDISLFDINDYENIEIERLCETKLFFTGFPLVNDSFQIGDETYMFKEIDMVDDNNIYINCSNTDTVFNILLKSINKKSKIVDARIISAAGPIPIIQLLAKNTINGDINLSSESEDIHFSTSLLVENDYRYKLTIETSKKITEINFFTSTDEVTTTGLYKNGLNIGMSSFKFNANPEETIFLQSNTGTNPIFVKINTEDLGGGLISDGVIYGYPTNFKENSFDIILTKSIQYFNSPSMPFSIYMSLE